MFDPKYLMNLLSRCSHSGFKHMVLHNRMLMQCYTVDIDSDQGFHYALHIPDTKEYEDRFFDETILLTPAEITKVYRAGHNTLSDLRKEKNLKTKDCHEECYYLVDDDKRQLKFMYYLLDELVDTQTVDLAWPFDVTDIRAESILRAYGDCLTRIKPGGVCLLYNLGRMGVIEKTVDLPDVYQIIVRVHKKKLCIPLTKTLFMSQKKFDSAYLSIQETTLDHIYIYALSLTAKGLNETIWGYVIRY